MNNKNLFFIEHYSNSLSAIKTLHLKRANVNYKTSYKNYNTLVWSYCEKGKIKKTNHLSQFQQLT